MGGWELKRRKEEVTDEGQIRTNMRGGIFFRKFRCMEKKQKGGKAERGNGIRRVVGGGEEKALGVGRKSFLWPGADLGSPTRGSFRTAPGDQLPSPRLSVRAGE